jgi:hypothetical protein
MIDIVVTEIWSELKRYIPAVDRAEAAEIVVSTLIDNDSDPDDIRDAFKGDADIKRALAGYMDEHEDEEEDDDEPDWDD